MFEIVSDLRHIGFWFRCLWDSELRSKSTSRELTDGFIRDIRHVDPTKWAHPVLSHDSERYKKLSVCYGYTKEVDGKTVVDDDRSFEDIYYQVHPDLSYRMCDGPFDCYPEGYHDQLTTKDRERIMKVFRNRVYK